MELGTQARDGLALGLVALGTLVLLDLVFGSRDNFAGAVVVAPMITATLAEPAPIVVVGVLTLAASLGLSWNEHAGPLPTSVRAIVVVIGSIAATWISHRRRLTGARLGHMSRIAEVAQRTILDPLPDRAGPAAIAGWYISATEEALIGGDFYHVSRYGDRARWIIGDVKGKGVEALRAAAAAVGAFREAAETLQTICEVVVRVDRRVARYLDEEGFATAIVAELHPDGRLIMVSCGHPPPVLLRDGIPTTIEPSSRTMPLGLHPVPCVTEARVTRGDSVWFLTDGVLEARRSDGDRGLDPEELAAGLRGSCGEIAEALLGRLQTATGAGLNDDSAAVVIEYRPLCPERP